MWAQTDDFLTRYARKTAKIDYRLSASECFLSGIYIVVVGYSILKFWDCCFAKVIRKSGSPFFFWGEAISR
jgi:hypothetical protein